MRKIIFDRLETGKSPVEAFFDSLTNKQFEKTAFVLDVIKKKSPSLTNVNAIIFAERG